MSSVGRLEQAQGDRESWFRVQVVSVFRLARHEPATIVFALALGGICLDYLLAPALNTVTPALSCFLLLLLISRRLSHDDALARSPAIGGISGRRLSVFFLLHLAGIALLRMVHAGIAADSPGILTVSPSFAAAKYMVLLPTAFLLPWAGWRRFDRLYRAEWVAAALALLTIDPYRIFITAWPWYCQGLGHFAHVLARPFVTNLQYVSFPTPTITGPALDVSIIFACSGLEAIKLFQILFGLMLVIDWPVLNKRRALIGYFTGMAGMLLANAVRIALLVITGNLAPRWTVQYHLTAGWIFFAIVVSVYIVSFYGWLVERPASAALATK
jgi:exosortase/archaeosortase family protein